MTGSCEILDTTLREGEQCFGVFFSIETKKRLALLLDELGVDFIEVGHPAAVPSLRQAAYEIARMDLRARLVGHARMDREEIRLVRDLGLPWVGLFSGISAWSLKRYGLSKQTVYDRTGESVRYAKELGLRVKFTCEDASRTDVREVIDFYEYLHSLGADRLSYADTLGILTPEAIEKLCAEIAGRMPFNMLHFHFHDDFGRAFDNAVAATQYGAQCIDASILGIGERMGLAPLEKVLALATKADAQEERRPGYGQEKLEEAIGLVAGSINYDHFAQRSFAHKSGIHINGVLKDPDCYEPVDPESRGDRRLFVLSKLIGRSGLRMISSRSGFEFDEKELEEILGKVKSDEFLETADDREITLYLTGSTLKHRTMLSRA
jgi:2-isopropylmalate synthase